MTDVTPKYDAIAERYSAHDYADAERYYARRAKLVVEHGPRLDAGATVLDVACGDGGLGPHLLRLGIGYHGVDGSARMVEVAQRVLGDRVVHGSFDYEPPEPVDATTIFRSLYLVPDRRAFLTRVRSYTRRKLVFDFDPRAQDRDAIVRDLHANGFEPVELRPFFLPQRAAPPAPIRAALLALERTGPLARAALKVRGIWFCAATPASPART